MVCAACKSYYASNSMQGTTASATPTKPTKPAFCMKCTAMKALQLGALFFVIANPEVYKLTGGDVLLHSLVFAVVIMIMTWKGLI